MLSSFYRRSWNPPENGSLNNGLPQHYPDCVCLLLVSWVHLSPGHSNTQLYTIVTLVTMNLWFLLGEADIFFLKLIGTYSNNAECYLRKPQAWASKTAQYPLST